MGHLWFFSYSLWLAHLHAASLLNNWNLPLITQVMRSRSLASQFYCSLFFSPHGSSVRFFLLISCSYYCSSPWFLASILDLDHLLDNECILHMLVWSLKRKENRINFILNASLCLSIFFLIELRVFIVISIVYNGFSLLVSFVLFNFMCCVSCLHVCLCTIRVPSVC